MIEITVRNALHLLREGTHIIIRTWQSPGDTIDDVQRSLCFCRTRRWRKKHRQWEESRCQVNAFSRQRREQRDRHSKEGLQVFLIPIWVFYSSSSSTSNWVLEWWVTSWEINRETTTVKTYPHLVSQSQRDHSTSAVKSGEKLEIDFSCRVGQTR